MPAQADILAIQTFTGQVVRYDELTGQPIGGWSLNAAAVEVEVDPAPQVRLYSGVAAADGVIYVSSNSTGHVLKFDLATGAPIGDGVLAKLPDNPLGVASPGALKVGPTGNLFVSDNGGSQVHSFTPAGELAGSPVNALQGVGGLAFRDDGSLLSAEFGTGAVYLGEGAPPSVLYDNAGGAVFGPNGIHVNSDDSFLLVDLFGDAVYSLSADGSTLELFASIDSPSSLDLENPPSDAQPSPYNALNDFPSDVLALPSGDVVVSTLGASQFGPYGGLLRYDPTGGSPFELAVDQFAIGAITLAPGLPSDPGDFNRDGLVDQADYDMWRDGYGSLVTSYSNADGNGDGVIDAADYTLWRDNAGVGATSSSAPEPSALFLAATTLAAAIRRRR